MVDDGIGLTAAVDLLEDQRVERALQGMLVGGLVPGDQDPFPSLRLEEDQLLETGFRCGGHGG